MTHILSNLFIFTGWLVLFALALVGLMSLVGLMARVLLVMPAPSERQRALPRGCAPEPEAVPGSSEPKARGILGLFSGLTRAKGKYRSEQVTQIQAQRAHAEITAADQLRRGERP